MKAVLKNGLIQPQEPVPEDWSEGTQLEVAKAAPSENGASGDDLDRWFAELEQACALIDPDDDRILQDAIQDIRREERELARKKELKL